MEASMRRSAVAGVVVSLVLSGCTAGGPGGQAGDLEDDEPGVVWQEITARSAWTLAGHIPMSPAVATDGGFVLYALDSDDQLEAIGVDAVSGEVRWRHPANQSWVVPGVGLHIAVSDGLAVFLTAGSPENAEAGWVNLMAVDAVTGEHQWTESVLRAVTSHPAFCGDSDQYLCLIGSQGDARWWTTVDRDSGRETMATQVEDARRISDRLFPIGNSSELVRIEFDGSTAWRRPVSELFGTTEVSPDHGWTVRNDDGRYVGWLGTPWEEVSDGVHRRDLSAPVLAAFDEETGEPLWAEPGVWRCAPVDFTLEDPVRCRSTGHVTFEEAEGDSDRDGDWTLDGEVTVEGFDPATGDTTWSWEAGEVPGLAFSHESARRVDDTIVVVATADGDVLLDISTGDQQRVSQAPTGWCYESSYRSPAVEVAARRSNEMFVAERYPCNAGGDLADLPVTVPEFVGARSGDVFAWVSPGGLTAVTVDHAG